MERALLVARLWNWLPAFRAVAETQSVHAAALELHVSPSALSRSVRLLEEDIGRPLFSRTRGKLQLNSAGERLLAAVRLAMRGVHEGLLNATELQLVGPVRISTIEPMTSARLIPALARLHEEHPGLRPYLQHPPAEEKAALLTRGGLDLAFTAQPAWGTGLQAELVEGFSRSVYCGAGHPLYQVEEISTDDLSAHPFVAGACDPPGDAISGCEVAPSCSVALRAPDYHAAAAACSRGRYLAELPDCLVADSSWAAQLRRLPIVLPPLEIYALRRQPLEAAAPDCVDVVLTAVRPRPRPRPHSELAARQQPARVD